MNFNRVTKQIVVFVAGFIMFFCLLGIAGTTDRYRTNSLCYATRGIRGYISETR